MERDVTEWFRTPWKNGRRAAGLAAELIRLILPPTPKVTAVTNTLQEAAGAYRGTVLVEHEDVEEDPEARDAILYVIQFVEAYRDGVVEQWDLESFAGPDQQSRVYDAARHYGEYAKWAAWSISAQRKDANVRLSRWYSAGEASFHAIHIVQKWAANSTASGYAFNHFLEQIARSAIEVEFERVAGIVCTWRYRDALDGAPSDEAHRVAFESAWELGKYEFSYQLMEQA